MIDHMERLILKGGGGGNSTAFLRTANRNASSIVGDRSGPTKADRGNSPLISIPASSSSSLRRDNDDSAVLQRADTYDDPFHDLPSSDFKYDGETDFFLERQRQNSFDLKTDITGIGPESNKFNYTARPNALSMPPKKSISHLSDSSFLSQSAASGLATSGGDSALLGVQQMLSLLRSEVAKPKNHHNHHSKTLEDIVTTPKALDNAGAKHRRHHSLMPQSSGFVSGDLTIPISEPPRSPTPNSISSHKSPDARRAEELALDLRLKSADNKFLQDELNKANLQIAKKDKILSVLTEGLKEVEQDQSQLVASRDELACELEVARATIHRLLSENQELNDELQKLKVFAHMEKTMKFSDTISALPSFTSFDESIHVNAYQPNGEKKS